MSDAPTAAHGAQWESHVNADIDRIIRIGLMAVGGFVLVFGLWASLFALSGAVVSTGTIVPIGQSKILAHPTGGTVVKVNVSDGQFVKAGTPILTLDPVVDEAELERLRARRLVLLAMAARLESERGGAKTVAFPSEMKTGRHGLRGVGVDARITELMRDQLLEFESRRLRNESELGSLRKQMMALEEEGVGLEARRRSLRKQARSLRGELSQLQPAAREGYVARTIVNELEREEANVTGEYRRTIAQIKGNEQKIQEIQYKISELRAAQQEKIVNELTKVRGELSDINNQIRGAERVVNLREVRSPVSGTVVRLATHALGGAIGPNEKIAEIVPSDAGLVAEVRVLPQDIDSVHVGQEAEITVTAFNQRLIDPIATKVAYVSANSTLDEKTGETYFLARLSITDPATVYNRARDIHAGMQVNAFIKSESRVFFSYLLKPVIDSFRRAFRER